MIVVAILLTWIVIGASYYWLGNARLVVSNLSTVQAPNLAQTSRLSAQTTDIAMLSNRILSEGSTSSSNLEALLKMSVSELIAFINDGLDTTLTPYDAEILQRQLLLVIRHLSQTQKIEIRIRNKIEQLRWLNVDVQDEAAAVMADFAYNIEVLTRRLAQESNPSIRTEMAKILTQELHLQSIFSNIGNDTATGTTLAMQISTSQSSAQLDQFEDLIADALARINASINILPSKPEYQFIRQAS